MDLIEVQRSLPSLLLFSSYSRGEKGGERGVRGVSAGKAGVLLDLSSPVGGGR
jgi:hypothetical protein